MPRSLVFCMLVISNLQIKPVLYLNRDDISKSVILTDVRIHLRKASELAHLTQLGKPQMLLCNI